jgi:NAD(P)-dependent dehydrogenase (short-subunit alcohol dehydrogenase family)
VTTAKLTPLLLQYRAAGGYLPDATDTLELNLFSQMRVTDAFRGCLDPADSRIVFISSGAGPMAVTRCSSGMQARLTNRSAATLSHVEAIAREFLAAVTAPDPAAALTAAGFSDDTSLWGPYGLSKALLNLYVLGLAATLPASCIANACSPGMIETDLLSRALSASGKAPSDVGALPPEAGTVAPLTLLFETIGPVASISGRYYGSDGLRSPMGAYRSPGTPAYDGPDA